MIEDIVLIIILHFIADFVCQTRVMGNGKSSSNAILFSHVLAYTTVFLIASFLTPAFGIIYVVVNGLAHGVTDWFTSRISKWLHQQHQMYWFFVILGLDQTIHMLTLILSYHYLPGG